MTTDEKPAVMPPIDWQRGTVSGTILRPQTLAVLKLLHGKAGQLVSKDEIMDSVWPGIAVTDDSLVQCITEIRKALRDEEHLIVKTVPKRGYMLESEALTPAATSLSRSWAWYLMPVLVLVAGIYAIWSWQNNRGADAGYKPSLAVLQFENLTGDPRWNSLASGLTEDVTADAALFKYISVAARHSVEAVNGQTADPNAAAKTLGVTYLIEGSVEGGKDGLRVQARLIDQASGNTLWSGHFDGNANDTKKFQEDAAGNITAQTVALFSFGKIAQAEFAKALTKPADARSAFEHLIVAVEGKVRYTPGSLKIALDAANRAVALRPDWALAYTARSWVHFLLMSQGGSWETQVTAQGKDVERAYQLDPRDGENVIAYSAYLLNISRFKEGDELSHKAVELMPYSPHVLLVAGNNLIFTGDPVTGGKWAHQSLHLDPYPEPVNAVWNADTLYYVGDYRKVVEVLSRLPAENRNAVAWLDLGASLAHLGQDFAEARKAILALRPGITAQNYYATEGFPFARADERNLFFDEFRLLGLPLCATAEQLKDIQKLEPLPECAAVAAQ